MSRSEVISMGRRLLQKIGKAEFQSKIVPSGEPEANTIPPGRTPREIFARGKHGE